MTNIQKPSLASQQDFSSAKFLRRMWRYGEGDCHFLGAKGATTDRWHEVVIRDDGDVQRFFNRYPISEYDLYFCLNGFVRPQRLKKFAARSPFSQVDIDGSNPLKYRPRPSLLWETSPGRYQGVWLWGGLFAPERCEGASKFLTYEFGGDKGGWSITKYIRIPGTINNKPQYRRPQVRLIDVDWSPQRIIDAEATQRAIDRRRNHNIRELTRQEFLRMLQPYRRALHPKTRYLLTTEQVLEPDRSGCIYNMVTGLHDAGASEREIAEMLFVNPFFISKYGHDERKCVEEVARILDKVGHDHE